MPQTSRVSNTVLGIQLEGNQLAYGPGDTIIGRVYRKNPIVAPNAQIAISLHGRAKSKLEVSRGNSNNTYRGRFTLVNPRKHSQVIFKGPLHISKSGDAQEWPFAVTIPTYCEPVRGQFDTFLPSDAEALAQEKLPPSYSGSANGGGTEGFVEYFVQADLRYWGAKDSHNHTSTYPFYLRQYLPDPPIADFMLKRLQYNRAVTSQRLVPGMEDAELTKSQKMKKFFGTSSVPSMVFSLEVETPTVIQLENPNTLPFRLRIVPWWDKTSEVIRDVPQKFKLTHFVLKLGQVGHIKCDGTFSTHDDSFNNKMTYNLNSLIRKHKTPIEVPCTDEWSPLDIGELLGLRFGHNGVTDRKPWPVGTGRLAPSFRTYNIRVIHRLSWELKFEVAGEEVDVKPMTEPQVVLIGPSDTRGEAYSALPPPTQSTESWIRPPDEGEAPPSFAEVQNEDKKEAQNSLARLENGSLGC